MKLLFDQNLSRRLVNRLADVFPDSSHVALLGLEEAPDFDILEYAAIHGYAIVSKDSDFRDLVIARNAAKVVLLDIGNGPTATVERLLRENADLVRQLDRSSDVLLILRLS